MDTGYTKVLLEDRGFDVFPAQKDITPANAFVLTSLVFTLVGVALICPNWTTRAIVLRRVFWVVGVLSIFRALTLSVTTLPTPKENCVPSTEKGFGAMFLIALQMIPGTVQACTDDIFSGHTVFMVTSAIQWRLYCRNKWVTYLAYIYITVGLYFVVATRLHYSVDVVLAIFITYAVWSLYIAMIDVVMEKEYFGLRRNYEKYHVFDDHRSEPQEEEEEESKIEEDTENAASTATRKTQIKQRLNRMRGPDIGYDRGEYSHVAFVPMQYNTWLTGAIRWCDGLDLRMRQSAENNANSRWEELVIERRSRHHSDASTTTPSGQPFSFRKHGDSDVDLEAGSDHGHGREVTVAPVMLSSVHVRTDADDASAAH
ncbi:sphingomyelin synthase [Modicella reniformis]|uniref:Sphingomyelin synthase n=1 Tax=Modicella reniformis TaxID=1440133 RepID=A0A9P6ST47_9FUNG|nr:sphingomyelin synthase [Modicella reniformis]